MKATLVNLSPLPRQHWAVVTFPALLVAKFPVEATFVTDQGVVFRAVRGRTTGCKTVYRIRATMSGRQKLEGELVPQKKLDAPPFAAHPWTSDNLQALIPNLGAHSEGRLMFGQSVRLDQLESSPAHVRFRYVERIPEMGLHFWCWLDLLHETPVLPFWGKIVWSDRNDPRPNRTFTALGWRSGEMIQPDFRTRVGMPAPTRERVRIADGSEAIVWQQMLNTVPITLDEGAGLPLSGSMLTYFGPSKTPMPSGHAGAFEEAGMRDLTAAWAGAEIVGVSHDWNGFFLANDFVPRFSSDYSSRSEAEWRAFADSLEVPAGWFAERFSGLGKTPGQTGGQDDFGAVKGTYACAELDARHIKRFQFGAQTELFRGFNFFESNGEPLRLDRHPDLTFWSGAVHWHGGVSPDRLGKDPALGMPPSSGWMGYDGEHASQNYQSAYMAMSDDPLIDDQVLHQLTLMRGDYRSRFPDFGTGAAREQGRTLGSMLALMSAAEPSTATGIGDVVVQRMKMFARGPGFAVSGPMKVLEFRGPDPRKPVFEDDGVTLAPWVSLWEHGLAMVHFLQSLRTKHGPALPPEWRPLVVTVAETLAQFGFFKEGGVWCTVGDIKWSGGEAPSGGLRLNSKQHTSAPGAGDVLSWTFAGVLAARAVLGPTHALTPRMDEYIAAITGGREAGTRTEAEWWAVVGSILSASK